MASDDTEITLGVGKLLGLFLLLAAICAIFFSIGFSLGKTSGHEQAMNDQPAPATVSADSSASTSNDPKPSAAVSTKPDSEASTAPASTTTTEQQGSLTFYNAVKQNDKAQQAANEAKASADQATGPRVVSAAAPAIAPPSTATVAHGSEVMSHTSPVTGPGTMVVQIAAVSREDDAVALAGALRKKNYNVFVVNNPVTNDKLYHVQVGPFSTLADAEAMKAKLISEGYNPIIKK
jgi:cytoskeletal protein RodZ